MAKFEVERSTVIRAPLEKVYSCVREFRNWPDWSPWLIVEPECRVTFAEDGRSYGWDGSVVGAGGMAVTGEEAPGRIDYRLEFVRPWKSVADVGFRFAEEGEGVRVTWAMAGSVPFFLFWMKSMIAAFTGMDFERGLAMLKDLLETGGVPSRLEVVGPRSLPGCRYVGVRGVSTTAAIGEAMERDFKRLWEACRAAGLEASGPPFSIYHRWDPVKGRAEYTAGTPVAAAPAGLPSGVIVGTMRAGEVYSIRHVGAYRHLGNAWAAGMFRVRSKAFRQDRRMPPFETYETAPADEAEGTPVTVVNFPMK